MTRILGIDPGSRITGFGIIELVDGKARYVTSGCVRLGAGGLPQRLWEIYEGVSSIVETYRPAEMVVERVFVKRNVDSALKLGQARGAAIVAGVGHSLPVFEYSPAEIKQALAGKGNAAKEQVQHMVRALLKLPGVPQADAADALAMALCHSQLRRTARRLDSGVAV